MFKLVCGVKGSGKTKEIIEIANTDCINAKGDCIFISDTDRYNYDLDVHIEIINVSDYALAGEESFLAFVQGISAARNDLTHLYIDGAHRICRKSVAELESFYKNIKALAELRGFNVTLTASVVKEDLPKEIAKL